jgi:hypothetical protein
MFRKLRSVLIVVPSVMLFFFATGSALAQQQKRTDPIKRPNNRTTVTPAPVPQIRVVTDREMVVISLGLPKPEAFTYNSATGAIKPLAGEIQDGIAIPGVGIVLKKNPGGGAITIPVSDGKGDLSSNAENGNYDLVITIPQSSLPGKPPASERKGVAITFALVKGPDGWGKGSGSPKQQNF